MHIICKYYANAINIILTCDESNMNNPWKQYDNTMQIRFICDDYIMKNNGHTIKIICKPDERIMQRQCKDYANTNETQCK